MICSFKITQLLPYKKDKMIPQNTIPIVIDQEGECYIMVYKINYYIKIHFNKEILHGVKKIYVKTEQHYNRKGKRITKETLSNDDGVSSDPCSNP